MEPLVDWDRKGREEIEGLREELTAMKVGCETFTDRGDHVQTSHEQRPWHAHCTLVQASLQLASSERDSLLRENDKIILYYKKVGGAWSCKLMVAWLGRNHLLLRHAG
jgi:hypothetical protein